MICYCTALCSTCLSCSWSCPRRSWWERIISYSLCMLAFFPNQWNLKENDGVGLTFSLLLPIVFLFVSLPALYVLPFLSIASSKVFTQEGISLCSMAMELNCGMTPFHFYAVAAFLQRWRGGSGRDPRGSTLCSHTVSNFRHELASLSEGIGLNLGWSSVQLLKEETGLCTGSHWFFQPPVLYCYPLVLPCQAFSACRFLSWKPRFTPSLLWTLLYRDKGILKNPFVIW